MAVYSHEMLAHEIDRGALDYSTLPLPDADWADLDPLEFERLRRLIRESGGYGDRVLTDLDDHDVARALGLVERRGDLTVVTAGALPLFGREETIRRYCPTHEVAFQVLKGLSVRVNEFFAWPLFRVAPTGQATGAGSFPRWTGAGRRCSRAAADQAATRPGAAVVGLVVLAGPPLVEAGQNGDPVGRTPPCRAGGQPKVAAT